MMTVSFFLSNLYFFPPTLLHKTNPPATDGLHCIQMPVFGCPWLPHLFWKRFMSPSSLFHRKQLQSWTQRIAYSFSAFLLFFLFLFPFGRPHTGTGVQYSVGSNLCKYNTPNINDSIVDSQMLAHTTQTQPPRACSISRSWRVEMDTWRVTLVHYAHACFCSL